MKFFRRFAVGLARLPPLVWAAPAGPPDDIDAMSAIKWKSGNWVDDSEGKIKQVGPPRW